MQLLSMLIDIPFYPAEFQNLTAPSDCLAFPPWHLFIDVCERCRLPWCYDLHELYRDECSVYSTSMCCMFMTLKNIPSKCQLLSGGPSPSSSSQALHFARALFAVCVLFLRDVGDRLSYDTVIPLVWAMCLSAAAISILYVAVMATSKESWDGPFDSWL